jgi:hypothetical protein
MACWCVNLDGRLGERDARFINITFFSATVVYKSFHDLLWKDEGFNGCKINCKLFNNDIKSIHVWFFHKGFLVSSIRFKFPIEFVLLVSCYAVSYICTILFISFVFCKQILPDIALRKNGLKASNMKINPFCILHLHISDLKGCLFNNILPVFWIRMFVAIK